MVAMSVNIYVMQDNPQEICRSFEIICIEATKSMIPTSLDLLGVYHSFNVKSFDANVLTVTQRITSHNQKIPFVLIRQHL